jgi:hypothetical protein
MQRWIVTMVFAGCVAHSLPAAAAEEPTETPADEAASAELGGWFLDPPFQRILDLQLVVAGWPGLWGLSLEANPVWFLSVEVGWNSNLGLLSNFNDVSVAVKSRFLQWVGLALDDADVSGHQVGLGPTVGYGFSNEDLPANGDPSPVVHRDHRLDVGLSFEWVSWASRYFGFSMQLETGPEVLFRNGSAWPTFFVRYSIGASF